MGCLLLMGEMEVMGRMGQLWVITAAAVRSSYNRLASR